MSNNLEQNTREIENAKYEYDESIKRMDLNIVDLLNYQHDTFKHIEMYNVNFPQFASNLRVGQ